MGEILRVFVKIMLLVTRSNIDILDATLDSCQARISRGACYLILEFVEKFRTIIVGLAPDKMVIPKGFILFGYSKKATATSNTCHSRTIGAISIYNGYGACSWFAVIIVTAGITEPF